MVPRSLSEEIVPARSYGLMENVGAGQTDIDQSDGDLEYFEACLESFPGDAGAIY